MKILLIQPPQWYPVSPFLAVPLLKGQLCGEGFEADALDLNVKFYNHILTSCVLREALDRAKEMFLALDKKFSGEELSEKLKDAPYDKKTEYLKYRAMAAFFKDFGGEAEKVAGEIEAATALLRDKTEFYNPEKLFSAKHTVNVALRIASLPFAPNEIASDNYFVNPALNLDWSNIKTQCDDISVNMFAEWFEKTLGEIELDSYGMISISMTDLSQLIPVFTLASMLKKRCNAKIVLGGNYATQIYEDMMRYEEIFTEYFDYLLIGDGEYSITRLAEHIDGRRELSEVPNLVCRIGGKVVCSGFSCERIAMNGLHYADFSDYNMSDYFIPEPVFPMQLSKGCYWGKCNFCDYFYGQQAYSPKRVNSAVEEIRYYYEKYGARKFIFVDEAIPPEFYNELASAIIKSGLKIHFYSFARLETGFTPKVLENLYAAGARLFLWGYECASERIMKLMNKGIAIDKRLEILENARAAGIWNNGLFIFGYPTETAEEISETMRVIRDNRNSIPSCTLSNFSLKKHSRLKDMAQEGGILGYSENGEFYTVFKDVIDGIPQGDRRSIRRNFQFDFLKENEHSLWSVVFSDFDHLLLYLAKYGCDFVCGYRSDEIISPEFR